MDSQTTQKIVKSIKKLEKEYTENLEKMKRKAEEVRIVQQELLKLNTELNKRNLKIYEQIISLLLKI